MYEPLLDYARRRNQEQLRKMTIERTIATMRPAKMKMNEHLLLGLSDLLLFLGNRIRPKNIYASAHESLMKQNNAFAKTIEGV